VNTNYSVACSSHKILWKSFLFVIIYLACFSTRAESLSISRALQLAEQNAPTLSMQEAEIEFARNAAIPAGELPDPKLFAALDNFPISGPSRLSFSQEPMTMQKIGIMQEVPNSAKRSARVGAAKAAVDRAHTLQSIERLRVRRETALAWITRYVAEQKLAFFDELEYENKLLADAVNTQQIAGTGTPTDPVLPREEFAMLAEWRDELVRDQSTSIAKLRRWIGADAEQPLAGDLPEWPIARVTLEHRLHQHPELTIFEPMGRMIDAGVKEAEAMKKPDWSVEFAYQHRDDSFGDMVSLQFTFDLPIFPGQRQDPQIAARRAERLKLDAEREATFREHTEMLESDLAEYEQISRAMERQQGTFLPLAQEKVDLALAAYRVNKSDLMSVITARRELIDVRLRVIDLEGQRSRAATRLHFTYGDDLP
jgi:outer membrane protein TolC